MSPALAERIENPRQMRLPATFERIAEVFRGLTDQGAQEFNREILEAMNSATHSGDLRPVQTVIESWYRSLLFRLSPGFEEALEIADRASASMGVYSASEIKHLLDV